RSKRATSRRRSPSAPSSSSLRSSPRPVCARCSMACCRSRSCPAMSSRCRIELLAVALLFGCDKIDFKIDDLDFDPRPQPEEPEAFQWIPPPGCPGDMSCVYKKLITRTHDDIFVIAKAFKKRADEGKLTSLHVAEIALAYVQTIPYEIPNDPFGLKPPPLVIAHQKGDCDSKALLLYMILTELGIEAVILSSQAHKHSMIRVALPANGPSFDCT